ncbi:hypothetical protein [Kitasatospora cheerisanensis]|uniref:Uncharacterized protein n=1 Tax=Kitasatospora cheerisanensis KCTC 2395 TaxID=1348663 RepID=A0A066YS60_9ACTN|nr:hypothetical protein [Kitasatospora cheerisanensis]KDN84393.1 hypothetical protein KCH_41840 [Kitasatospora cheerisanensis KCTC 2395]
MNTPPAPPSYPPNTATTGTWPYLPHTQAPAPVPVQPAYHHQLPQPVIPVLPPDHHHTVDWAKVRRTVKAVVRPSTVTGAALSPFYAHWALPLAVQHGPYALGGLAFILTIYAAVGGQIGRWIVVVVLVAAGLGTLLLAPATLAHHLMGI